MDEICNLYDVTISFVLLYCSRSLSGCELRLKFRSFLINVIVKNVIMVDECDMLYIYSFVE